ncbi:hypothetical protein KDA_74560 [Dictyobacter alpinus]|uniref:Uncharacterized protein n=1 Tax=Dictyobacter alpinus TaxID=2014873 RepID=A0A402BKW2_9CHLR|nr:hypothetical protein [Dictyobacter alpinus]GCE31972.1 hypothetical protein KDA_74560 [Dictyobacter alpinus]
MLRQFFTSDAETIRAAIEAYRREAGPRVVARLVPGACVVEIVGTKLEGNTLRVQTTDLHWHTPFACYKDIRE